jgi:hypothetical protein
VNRIRDREARTSLRITNWSVPCRQRGCGDEGMDRSGWTPGHDAQRSKRVHGDWRGAPGSRMSFVTVPQGGSILRHPITPFHTCPHPHLLAPPEEARPRPLDEAGGSNALPLHSPTERRWRPARLG